MEMILDASNAIKITMLILNDTPDISEQFLTILNP